MIRALANFLEINNGELSEIKEYFEKCAGDIDRSNLFMLRRVCMYTSIVYLGMLFLAALNCAGILIPFRYFYN